MDLKTVMIPVLYIYTPCQPTPVPAPIPAPIFSWCRYEKHPQNDQAGGWYEAA